MLQAVGKPMLEHMLERISRSQTLDKIVVATTTTKIDDEIEKLCKRLNFQCIRGSEDDVLSRYELASQISGAKTVVRLCGDSPLLDSNTIDEVVGTYLRDGYDYVNNLTPLPRTFPDGTGVEVFSSNLLREINLDAKKPSEREHVTSYIWQRPQKYKIHRVDHKEDLSNFRFNLDYKEDFEFIKIIYENLYNNNHNFSMLGVVEWLRKHPEVININSHIKPNQGWLKSLEKDKQMGFS